MKEEMNVLDVQVSRKISWISNELYEGQIVIL